MSICSIGPALFMEGSHVRLPKMVKDKRGNNIVGVSPLTKIWASPKEYPDRQDNRTLRLKKNCKPRPDRKDGGNRGARGTTK